MPILTRYVLFELIKVFLVALAGVTLFCCCWLAW